jgi:hypothetical protein
MKLTDKDGRVVDMLLDRPPANPADNGAFVKSVDVPPERVQTIQKVLSLLNGLPAEDPAPDLASRTLRKVEAASKTAKTSSRPPPPARLGDRQPPA